MTVTPATIARTVIADQNEAAARRADAARNGYRGPLTRAELAAQAARRADFPAGRNIPR